MTKPMSNERIYEIEAANTDYNFLTVPGLWRGFVNDLLREVHRLKAAHPSRRAGGDGEVYGERVWERELAV